MFKRFINWLLGRKKKKTQTIEVPKRDKIEVAPVDELDPNEFVLGEEVPPPIGCKLLRLRGGEC